MDPTVVSVAPGSCISIVARAAPLPDGKFLCKGLSPIQTFVLEADIGLEPGLYTFYDLLKDEDSRTCVMGPGTQIEKHVQNHHFDTVTLIDLCCGMGGFSLGSHRLGMQTACFVDHSKLACEAIQANFHGHVICGDVGSMDTMKQVHRHRGQGHVQVTGGFACQGFSTQGDQKGMADQRSSSLHYILRAAWLLQADQVLLECVANVQHFSQAQNTIDAFAVQADMRVTRLIFDLQLQWPVRRNRFWGHLIKKHFPRIDLPPWPLEKDLQMIGAIMPIDALWEDQEEDNLAWDAEECELYLDPAYGTDPRFLQPEAKAQTVLHSWGHVTRPCSCGCRAAFNPDRLRRGGVRGFGLISAKTGKPRHLHPQEASMICTVPLKYKYPMSPRAALCLLGQIAAPIQVLWIQSHIMAGLQVHHWGWTAIDPIQMIRMLQHELRFDAFTKWTTRSMYQPRHIRLQLEHEDQILDVKIDTPVTVRDLMMAEKQCGDWGHYVVVLHQGCRLSAETQLIPGVIYTLQRRLCKQLKPLPQTNQIYAGGEDATDSRLGDALLWTFMQAMLNPDETPTASQPFMLHPFRALHLLEHDHPDALTQSWQTRSQAHNRHLLLVCELHGHWILLHGRWDEPRIELTWTYYDGLHPLKSRPWLLQVVHKMSSMLGGRCGALNEGDCILQADNVTCGTLVLLHMAQLLGLLEMGPIQEIDQIHAWLLEIQRNLFPDPMNIILAGGPDTWQKQLADLLHSKGVPWATVEDRCKLVTDKLGAKQVQNCLRAKNPWAELKAAANRPGSMVRLLTQTEQKEYIQHRAQTKHGAQVKNHKQKKSQKAGSRDQLVRLDPDQFELDSRHFKDEDDLPVEQITYDEVGAEGRGVALCAAEMAAKFLQQPVSITTDALALLLLDVTNTDVINTAKLTPIVIPAKFKGTDEHTLIYGHIMQLGDSEVSREKASTDSSPDVITTGVVKMQVYRDQLNMDWARFTTAPIRALIGMIDPLQLCMGKSCGSQCGKYHPAVDETLEQVIFEIWARTFLDENGKTANPDQAAAFTVFLRIPKEAVSKVMTLTPAGVYLESRGKKPGEHDDSYRVVWLPGSSADDAAHHCRTFDKAISLVRLRNKFGIRVKKEDEQAAWAHLRPGTTFTPMTLQHIFELSPIPHGTQRQAIVKLLQDWKWLARPLQPGRGCFEHMTWRVGAQTIPPHNVMTGFQNDVIITQVKEIKTKEPQRQLLASSKTQRQLRAVPLVQPSKTGADPWADASSDPWGKFVKTTGAGIAPDGKAKLNTLQEQLRQDLTKDIETRAQAAIEAAASSQGATGPSEHRIQALEVGLQELKGQNQQFTTWFKQASEQMQSTENTIGVIQSTLNTHQHEIHTLGSTFQSTMKTVKNEISHEMTDNFNSQFARLEALLEKKQRTTSTA
eukprot:Skav226643  [mRNA]  locus=scaffold1097:87671:91891:+ [translate_table: standard]